MFNETHKRIFKKCISLLFVVILPTFQSCDIKPVEDNSAREKTIISNGMNLSLSEVERDPAFDSLVVSVEKLSDETYNGLRRLGSFKKRHTSQDVLDKLAEGGISETEFPRIAQELDISQSTYLQLVGSILNNKATLLRKYGPNALSSVPSKNISYHIQRADIKLAASYQSNNITVLNRQPVCTNCPFNNCGECSGGDPSLPTVPGGGGFGNSVDPCSNCRNGAASKRTAARNIAQVVMLGAVLGCGSAGLGAAEQIYSSTFLLNLLGPEAPATLAALGGITVSAACLTGALTIYRNTITLIEAEYQIEYSGCPCNR